MNFSEWYIKSRGAPLQRENDVIVPMYRRRVDPGTKFTMTWIRAISTKFQAIVLSLHRGSLTMNGEAVKKPILWRDTAPDSVSVVCNTKGEAELHVWNPWRDESGTTHAWIGNAGIIIEEFERGQVVRARCNSGPEITFEDLVFELRFETRA